MNDYQGTRISATKKMGMGPKAGPNGPKEQEFW